MTFDPATFLAESKAAVLTVKRALVQRNADVARRVMTDQAWADLRAQLEALKAQSAWQRLDGLLVTDATVESAQSGAAGEQATARVSLSAQDYVIDDTGKTLIGYRETNQWSEDWIFSRQRDPATDVRAFVCPLCGAPLNMDADGACTYCHAPVPGLPTDWLVVHMQRVMSAPLPGEDTAESTTVTRVVAANTTVDGAAAAGLSAISAHDPAFASSDVITLAREAIMTIERARAELNPRLVRPLVADALWHAETEHSARMRAAGEIAVRAFLDIDDATLVRANSDRAWDVVTVAVRGRSADHVVDLHSGRLLSGSDEMQTWVQEVVMARASGAKTNAFTPADSGLCPACLVGFAVDDAGNCLSCHRHITGGEFGWVVTAVGVPRPA